MVQLVRERRLEQMVGAVGLLFLATLFNSQGLRLLCLGLALKTVILRPQHQAQSQRLVMVSVLGLVAIYLGSLPGLICLVIAEFANHLLSGRLERGEIKITDLAIETAYLVPLLFAFLLDLGHFRSAEIAIYFALGLRMTQWPFNFKVSKFDGIDRVISPLLGLAIVKTVSLTSFENWPLGAVLLVSLSCLSQNLSQGVAVVLTFLSIVNPSCTVFFAPALFCVEEDQISALLLPLVLIPCLFLVQPGVLFAEHWWIAIPFFILSVRGFSRTSFQTMGQRRKEEMSSVVLTLILLGLGIYHLQKDLGSAFVSERLPEFVLAAVLMLAIPLWVSLGKMKASLSKDYSGLQISILMKRYSSRITFGEHLKDERVTDSGAELSMLDHWTGLQRGPALALLGFIATFAWGIFWVIR